MRIGADDDLAVIGAAQDVWEALGPNAYGLHFKHRPRTYRGFVEGRNWMTIYVVGGMALIFGGIEADDRYGIPWWLAVPAIVAWTFLLLKAFRARFEAGARVAGKELPYF
jgi:hypothetical protein